MRQDSRQLASKVVEAFRDLLDEELCEAIGEERWRELQGMVREALAEQSETILDRLAEDLGRLRDETVERRPLEL